MSQLSSPFKSHDETGKRENGKTAAVFLCEIQLGSFCVPLNNI